MDRRDFLRAIVAGIAAGAATLAAPHVGSADELLSDASFLEQLIQKMELAQTTYEPARWVGEYNPSINWDKRYQETVDALVSLDKEAYLRTHSQAPSGKTYSFDRVNAFLWMPPREKGKKEVKRMSMDVKYISPPSDPLDKEKELRERFNKFIWITDNNQHWIHLPTGILDWYHNLTPAEANIVFYVATGVAQAVYQTIKQESDEWKAKPWREPLSEFKGKKPVDRKTGEFTFYGRSDCEPCHVVAAFLLEHKIKFKERESFERHKDGCDYSGSGVPYTCSEKGVILGGTDIIELAKQMYGIQGSSSSPAQPKPL